MRFYFPNPNGDSFWNTEEIPGRWQEEKKTTVNNNMKWMTRICALSTKVGHGPEREKKVHSCVELMGFFHRQLVNKFT